MPEKYDQEKFLSISEAAAFLRMGKENLRRLVHLGAVKAYAVPHSLRYLFKKEDLLAAPKAANFAELLKKEQKERGDCDVA